MTTRMGKDCDICHHSTFKLLAPRVFLQCSRCGIRCHKQHYDDQESIPACKGKQFIFFSTRFVSFSLSRVVVSHNSSTPAKSLLIMCNSDIEQRQWIEKLYKKIPRIPNHQDDSSK